MEKETSDQKKFECAFGFHDYEKKVFLIKKLINDKRDVIITAVVCKHCRCFGSPIGFSKDMKEKYKKTGQTIFSKEEYTNGFPDDDATVKS